MIPISVKNLIDTAKQQKSEATESLNLRRSFVSIKDLNPTDFKELLQIKCERIFLQRSEPKEFQFNDHNKAVIKQLYYYLVGSNKFEGSLYKGIHLYGDFGTTKTTLLQAICEIVSEFTSKVIEIILAKDLGPLLISKGLQYYSKRPLFIDDIGRESREVKDFGNTLHPVPDLYYIRKETGAWTLQTCQKKIDDLEPIYGKFTTDRMKAAFNEIHMNGTSLR